MKNLIPAALLGIATLGAAATISVPTPAFAFQWGTETHETSGVFNGVEYNAITINWYEQSMTFHFVDGGQYTTIVSSREVLEAVAASLRRAKNVDD